MKLRHFLRLFPVIAAMAYVLDTGAPARAQDIGCPQRLRECYARAARRDDFWDMWVAGIECEFDFIECIRRGLMGR